MKVKVIGNTNRGEVIQGKVITGQQVVIRHKGKVEKAIVVRTKKYNRHFVSYDDKSIIGSHGGLYPEEVVVGFSVMKKILQRVPVIITCSGEGKPREPGILSIKFVKSLAISVLTRLVFLLADSQRLEFPVLSLSGCWIKLCLVMDH